MQQDKNRSIRRALRPLRDFLHTESAGGALLVAAAVVALVWANSPWRHGYDSLWHTEIGIEVGSHALRMSLQHWLNDGLMTVFFLVVGLEIKRELTSGHLAGLRAATLPIAAAVGGMVLPAALYLAIAGRTAAEGWGVPMATDIALAVGVLALAGAGAPAGLRAFLLGLAVVDDIGAIIVIAIFYSSGVGPGWLLLAAAAAVVTVLLRRMGVYQTWAYVLIGAVMWFAMHEGGIHPTLTGVVMGLLAPSTPRIAPDFVDAEELADVGSVTSARSTAAIARSSVSTVEWLEHVLHPFTSYLVVPLFALANAGIELSGSSLRQAWGSPITWGILVGLVVGKPLGVLLAARLAVRSGRADPPAGTSTRQLLGAGHAAGIGFTVALFIAELAFRDDGVPDVQAITDAKVAILLGSVLSGALAF
ncbi:MAG: Na+/H+ antiporter NhaA, partial [Acidobacteria bacterium]|nr:Na+/H+ antiporter NhaA [Acidobacteriota bacterium]